MDKRYGTEGGALLRMRLADMRAAECLGDVPLLILSTVDDSLKGEATITICPNLRMVVKANHRIPPKLDSGDINWPCVRRILIQRIECVNG